MMKRRHFLQFTSSTVAVFGLNYLNIIKQGNRYAQAVGQTSSRKLALLIGINKYPNNQRFVDLQGCMKDVEMQEKLLIHRFGFDPKDIVKLTTDSPLQFQPTRNNILTQFENHLINQANPGDVVVFYFSGHGSRLRDPNSIYECDKERFSSFNSTLVPPDQFNGKIVPDIMGRTLFLLRSALKTDNVTMILDSCESGGGTRGNTVIRSVPGDGYQPLSEEIAYQERWMKKLGWTAEEFTKRRCKDVGKGVVIAAAKKGEEAADVPIDNFHAGAFTYFLSQYLWQQEYTTGKVMDEIRQNITQLQNPVLDGNPNQPVYFISTKNIPSSDAIITDVNGNILTLWLGGIDSNSLTGFRKGATFAVVDNKGQASGTVELILPRDGLVAKAKLVEKTVNIALKPGTFLQESSRVIPADLKLRIGLDASLAKQTSIAQTLLSKMNRIEPIQQGTNKLYPKEVQYIFSRMTADYHTILQKQGVGNLPQVGSIGLFTSNLELLPDSFSKPGKSVDTVLTSLETKIKSLLATFIISKILNSNSSQLDIEVGMSLVEQPNNILALTSTLRSVNKSNKSQTYSNRLPMKKLFQFEVHNKSSEDIYVVMFLIDSSGDITLIYPFKNITNESSMLVSANQKRVIGDPKEMSLSTKSKGSAEAFIITSRSPLKRAVKILKSLDSEQKQNQSSQDIDISREPVEVVDSILDDLTGERNGVNGQDSAIKVTDIAALSLSFEVG